MLLEPRWLGEFAMPRFFGFLQPSSQSRSFWFRHSLVLMLGLLGFSWGCTSGARSQDRQPLDIDYALSLLNITPGKEYDSEEGKAAVKKAIEYISQYGITPYDFGVKLYNEGHENDSFFWYESLGIATNEAQYFYGRAFYEWRSGNAEAAIRDIEFMIKKELPPIIKARAYYLRGRINLQSRFLEQARKDLLIALETYGSIEGKYGGEYLCLRTLARVAVFENNYDVVKPLLEEAIKAHDKNVEIGNRAQGLGPVYEVMAEFYFEKGDYASALVENNRARKAYLEKNSYLADIVLVKIGLLELMNGDPKRSYEICADLLGKLKGKPRGMEWAYLAGNIAILAMCSGQNEEYDYWRKEAMGWARPENGGQDLIELITFLENEFDCPDLKEETK